MIDKSKTYRTRDGRPVRIYATDGGGDQPVHAAIKNPDGWKGVQFQADGTWCEVETPADLIEVKPRIKREFWVNVYRAKNGLEHWLAFELRDTADEAADEEIDDRIACVKVVIDCEEGTGL